jgi:hypothetical protein
MKLNNPFNFPKGDNSTTILNDFVFSNNKGLALFFLALITVMMASYDYFKTAIKNRIFPIKMSEKTSNFFGKFKCHPLLKKYSSWLINLDL